MFVLGFSLSSQRERERQLNLLVGLQALYLQNHSFFVEPGTRVLQGLLLQLLTALLLPFDGPPRVPGDNAQQQLCTKIVLKT